MADAGITPPQHAQAQSSLMLDGLVIAGAAAQGITRGLAAEHLGEDLAGSIARGTGALAAGAQLFSKQTHLKRFALGMMAAQISKEGEDLARRGAKSRKTKAAQKVAAERLAQQQQPSTTSTTSTTSTAAPHNEEQQHQKASR